MVKGSSNKDSSINEQDYAPDKSFLATWCSYRNSVIIVLLVALNGVSYGYEIGLVGGLLEAPSFRKDFHMPKEPKKLADEKGNIVVILLCGQILGGLVSLFLPDWIGRRKAMIISTCTFLVGAIVQITCAIDGANGRAQLYIGRFIAGAGMGCNHTSVGTFIAEVSPRQIRGGLNGTFFMFVYLGTTCAFFANFGVQKHYESMKDVMNSANWRIPTAFQVIPAGIALVGAIMSKETPRWFVLKGRWMEAKQSSAFYLRQDLDSPEVEDLVMQIQKDVNTTAKRTVKTVFKEATQTKNDLLRFVVPSLAHLCAEWSGLISLAYYSPQIFKELGVVGRSAGLFATGIYGIVKTVTAVCALLFTVDRFGRKWPAVIGTLIQAFAMFFIAISGAATQTPNESLRLATISMIYVFTFGFCFGLAMVISSITSEAPPTSLRVPSMGVSKIVASLSNLALGKLTPIMLLNIPNRGTFFIFGTFSLVATLFTIFIVPETSNLPLEGITYVFERTPYMKNCVTDLSPRKRRETQQFVISKLADNDTAVKEKIQAMPGPLLL